MSSQQVVFSHVKVGDELPELVKKPTAVQIFRYSAVTWNSHRIHYDEKYAYSEGYPDILVQSHLHGAFLTQLCTDWMGVKGELQSLEVSIKRFAMPGDTLISKGTVIEKSEMNGDYLVTVELKEVNQNGKVNAPGKAVIKLPYE